MPYYIVTLEGSVSIRVIAESEDEAETKAFERVAYESVDPADYVMVNIEEELEDE